MLKYLAVIIVSVLTTLISAVVLFNYLPLHYLESNTPQKKFGATITTINGSDTISSSRAVINTNFSNLNSDKMEVSTTSVKSITTLSNLTTVGTITSGIWNGTRLTVPYGGTGSTTLSANQVLLGNGTSGITTPSGYGTSGQFLTSAGTGAAPTWTSASFDTTLNYTVTGGWIFPRSTTTQATSTYLNVSGVASTSQLIVGSLGVGVPTTTQRNAQIANNLEVDGMCTSGCSQKIETSVFAFTPITGSDGATRYTHTGDTLITQLGGSKFDFDPTNYSSDVRFRVEAGGSASSGNFDIGFATTTSHFIPGATVNLTNSTGYATTTTFGMSVMPSSPQTIFCAVQANAGSVTASVFSCRLVVIISR